MSAQNFIRLYTIASPAQSAFLLNEGRAYFFVSNTDKYALRGNNLIVGASELILNNLLDMNLGRLETALCDPDSRVKKIPAETFLSSLDTYSVALNVSMVIAEQVVLTNQIINTNLECVQGDEKRIKETSIEYYRIVSRLRAEYEKRRLPWLKALTEKFETSLICKRGEAFGRTAAPTKITTPLVNTETTLELPRDSVICEEGSMGDEMYILQAGTVDVLINGTRVTSISDHGYVFGEIALLLGEKRTATLKAKSDVLLTRLRKSDLKNMAGSQHSILRALLTSLAQKHYYNIEKIKAISAVLIEKDLSAGPGEKARQALEVQRAQNDLLSLKKEVSGVYETRKVEFLAELVESF
ncbi:MAG: cyclic nucleotide-binding domain-containing protein [Spirochaetes bacterium]|jgi:CRP-like cAMP-binding protein|nr:cyclic nucleotide-binding domain-containing protein [Spirochaetota bacterium]